MLWLLLTATAQLNIITSGDGPVQVCFWDFDETISTATMLPLPRAGDRRFVPFAFNGGQGFKWPPSWGGDAFDAQIYAANFGSGDKALADARVTALRDTLRQLTDNGVVNIVMTFNTNGAAPILNLLKLAKIDMYFNGVYGQIPTLLAYRQCASGIVRDSGTGVWAVVSSPLVEEAALSRGLLSKVDAIKYLLEQQTVPGLEGTAMTLDNVVLFDDKLDNRAARDGTLLAHFGHINIDAINVGSNVVYMRERESADSVGTVTEIVGTDYKVKQAGEVLVYKVVEKVGGIGGQTLDDFGNLLDMLPIMEPPLQHELERCQHDDPQVMLQNVLNAMEPGIDHSAITDLVGQFAGEHGGLVELNEAGQVRLARRPLA